MGKVEDYAYIDALLVLFKEPEFMLVDGEGGYAMCWERFRDGLHALTKGRLSPGARDQIILEARRSARQPEA